MKVSVETLKVVFSLSPVVCYVAAAVIAIVAITVWSPLSLIAWGCFPIEFALSILISLITLRLQQNLVETIQELESSLIQPDTLLKFSSEKEKAKEFLKRDSKYWLILKIFKLIPELNDQYQSLQRQKDIDLLVESIESQRASYNKELRELSAKYFRHLKYIQIEHHKSERKYAVLRAALQNSIVRYTRSTNPTISSLEDLIIRVSSWANRHPDITTLRDIENLLRWMYLCFSPNVNNRTRSVKQPVGNFIGKVDNSSTKYHFERDCRQWKALRHDYMLEEDPGIQTSLDEIIFNNLGMEPCQDCESLRKKRLELYKNIEDQ